MAGMLNCSQTAQVGASPSDNQNEEQNSQQDQQKQAISCEKESCCVKEGVVQDKSESSQTPNITQALATAPLHTQRAALELCWYCLKSLSIEAQVEREYSTMPSSGERLKYQLDPRPHFGVPQSSRSISFPLWDSGRLREIKEEEDDDEDGVDSFSCCPHCHLGLPRDTLRWHEAKCLLFDGVKNSYGWGDKQ